MHAFLNIALRAARDAAEAAAHSSDRLDRVKILSQQPGQFSTSMDKDANRTILYHLKQAYPDHCYQSRLSGYEEGSDKSTVWIIEPLAGNFNFSQGYSQFAISIACKIGDKIRHAVVINPLLNEEYSASRGGGAQLNSRRIRVSDATSLAGGIVALNPGNAQISADAGQAFLGLTGSVLQAESQPRNSGCTTLDLLAVASGRATAGWSAPQLGQDLTAPALILAEAGGLLSNTDGSPGFAPGQEFVFANARCLKQMLQLRASVVS